MNPVRRNHGGARLYRPALWIWILWGVLGAGLTALFHANPGFDWRYPVLSGVVASVLVLVLGMVLGQVLWQFSERRHRVFDFIFAGVLGCGFLGAAIYSKEARLAHEEKVAEEMEELRDALRKRQSRRAAEVLDQLREQERLEVAKRFERYASMLEPEEIAKLQTLDTEMLAAVDEVAARYRKVIRENPVAGPARWLRMKTRDELETERAAQLAVYEQTRAFLEFVEGFDARYEGRIEELELGEQARLAALAEKERIVQAWETGRVYELRRLDAAIMGVAVELLNILLEHWGQWRIDDDGRNLEFADLGVQREFLIRLEGLQMLAREQEAIAREREGEPPRGG